jgi:hypothetical protein
MFAPSTRRTSTAGATIAASPQAQEFLRALGTHIARSQASRPAKPEALLHRPDRKDSPRYTICVLPFVNMSGDPEQEYFSDGITEDIITDLSKVSALGIIARNSAFMYKEKNVDILKVARELKVSHVLEGSVRKPAAASGSTPSSSTARPTATSGRIATTAIPATSSRCRTRFPRRSSRP